MAADCKSAGLTLYVGSNPTPTISVGDGEWTRRRSGVRGEGDALSVRASVSGALVRGCSSVGRASAFQAEGRGFESRRPLAVAGMGSALDVARVAQLVEHILGKDEVTGSIPVASLVDAGTDNG